MAKPIISHIYGAHTVAGITLQHVKLMREDKITVTLPSSKWNLWDPIVTGAALRPFGYHTAQMAQSSHPDIVTKICSNRASKYMVWNSLGGGHCIHNTDLAQVMVHLVELVLQVKIYVYLTSAAEQWSLEELTWADPKNLTPEYLLHTIDPRIAHQTELPSALAKELRYNTAPGWYLNRKKHTTHISARRF
jgi:hypothetical protein